ncbi:hypothetical protein EDB85DRAFT_2159780 [Lactarius pseudohatsudake]|nr:hypothetical protein EDB85DRAFT_2159780 [Lactarius pseudohatsudake]
MEKEQVQAELRKGVHMKDGDIDSYVATFERLARQADYNLDAPQTIDLFTAGLPKGLFTKVYEQYEPTTFEAWKQAAMKKQQQLPHVLAPGDPRKADGRQETYPISKIPTPWTPRRTEQGHEERRPKALREDSPEPNSYSVTNNDRPTRLGEAPEREAEEGGFPETQGKSSVTPAIKRGILVATAVAFEPLEYPREEDSHAYSVTTKEELLDWVKNGDQTYRDLSAISRTPTSPSSFSTSVGGFVSPEVRAAVASARTTLGLGLISPTQFLDPAPQGHIRKAA